MDSTGQTTQLPLRAAQGGRTAEEQLVPIVYGELRKMIAYLLRSERPDQTLQAAALVHEAYRFVENEPGLSAVPSGELDVR